MFGVLQVESTGPTGQSVESTGPTGQSVLQLVAWKSVKETVSQLTSLFTPFTPDKNNFHLYFYNCNKTA